MNKRKRSRRRYWIDLILAPLHLNGMRTKLAGVVVLFLSAATLFDISTSSISKLFYSFSILKWGTPVIAIVLLWSVVKDFDLVRFRVYLIIRTEKRPPPSLAGLVHFADWWGLDLRKRIKSLAGDYDAEIRRLCHEDRYLTARWNKFLAWTFAFWYIGRGPWDWLRALLLLAVKGK